MLTYQLTLLWAHVKLAAIRLFAHVKFYAVLYSCPYSAATEPFCAAY